MNIVKIDFKNVKTNADFYEQLKTQINLPEYFGDNLDALYDVLTGYIELPACFELENVDWEQTENLQELFATLDDAEIDTDSAFMYICEFVENE